MNAQSFERIGDRTRGATQPNGWVRSALVLGVVFSGVLLGVAEQASGQANPPGCTFAGSGASIQPVPSGPVVHGATICYNVCYTVPNGIINSCNVVNFGANLFFPDGSSVSVVSGASIERGTSFCCGPNFDEPADPRCNPALDTGPSGDYCYVVNHADEVASFTGCPPVPSGSAGRVVAYTQGTGDSQTELGDDVAPCATANNIVQHACCEPCTGTCTNVNSAANCPFPSVFTPDRSCAEVTCTPLSCPGPVPPCEAGQICNPATGTCQNQPDAPLSTPCTTCPGGDTNCNNCHCNGSGLCVNNPEPLSTPCTGCPGGDTECNNCHCNGSGQCTNLPEPLSTPCTTCPGGDTNCNNCHCDGSGQCTDLPEPLSTPCEEDTDECTTEHCDGNGDCVLLETVVCPDPVCDSCNSATGACEPISPPPTGCQQFVGCRITGGRTVLDGEIIADPDGVQIIRGQGGGQVGAPCGCIGCFTTRDDPFEHVQGNWQYGRKNRQGTFHAKEFNSLVCGCDANSPACDNTGVSGSGFGVPANFSGELCNPDNPIPGPEPRPSPANLACFSGKGDWSFSNGRKTTVVAFRVEVEDRGEPAVGPNSDDTCDVFRIRIWIPDRGEDVNALAHGACCTNAVPVGPAARTPNIDDGGNLVHGNLQIHPQTPNSRDGTCPVPDGACQE